MGGPWARSATELTREAFIKSLKPDFVQILSLFEDDEVFASVGQFDTQTPVSIVLYDLIPLIHAKRYLDHDANVKERYLKKIATLQRSALLLAISGSSRQEGVDHLDFPSENIINISSDADPHFYPLNLSASDKEALFSRFQINKPFVMFTGGGDPRKNIEGLIRAFALLESSVRHLYQLVIVCSLRSNEMEQLQYLGQKSGLEDGELVLTGYVSDADLVAFYNTCTTFVFPSFHEGFGLPVLEAMRCGKSVLVSNSSSLPEVVGRSDVQFDPHSDAQIAAKMVRVLSDDAWRKELEAFNLIQARQFSWDKSAKRALEAMERLHCQKAHNQAPASLPKLSAKGPRLKLAYVSPLPSERSGIASYSAELLPYLHQHYEIDVVNFQEKIDDPWIAEHCRLLSPDQFVDSASHYDRVVYHFGNSTFHEHMFDLLEKVPGVVVQHDFFISNLLHHLDAVGYTKGNWPAQIYRSHGYGAFDQTLNDKDSMAAVWRFPANKGVLQSALGVILHSPSSQDLVEQWYGSHASQAVAIIPLLRIAKEPFSKQAARNKLNILEDAFVVCSFGLLSQTKLNTRLLEAWVDSVLAKDPRCVLYFVGEASNPEYRDALWRIAKDPDIASRVHITGWTDDEQFQAYLEAADMAVQLRGLSRGETSAAVLDCLNHELPTIINASGSMRNLDEKVVYKLPEDFTNAQLVFALETLFKDQDKRNVLGTMGRRLIVEQHDPSTCAAQYHEAIEHFYRFSNSNLNPLLSAIIDHVPSGAPLSNSNQAALAALSSALGNTFVSPLQERQLLIDLTPLINATNADAKAMFSKPAAILLQHWLKSLEPGIRLEPIYFANGHYCYARQFVATLLGCAPLLLDEPIQCAQEDLWLSLDHHSLEGDRGPEHRWFSVLGNSVLELDVPERQLKLLGVASRDELLCPETILGESFWKVLGGHTYSQDKLEEVYGGALSQILAWVDSHTQRSELSPLKA
jgi:glycosyltransferase involved in cell wall biosynthesis